MLLHQPSPEGLRTIQDGGLVVVYESFNAMKAVKVDRTKTVQNRHGVFHMKDWVGLPFGSRVVGTMRGAPSGWMHLLAPTPELWTLVLRHRTQILYVADIAMVIAQLELRPGSIALECGTGSGSLTHSLARAVAPTGMVHTFEFHAQRAEMAAQEFKDHGIGDVVTVAQRNIEEHGFPEELHNIADGVFLDLPSPWKAVESAAMCLKADGVFCGFSPCIEQVQKTAESLNKHGFRDMKFMELVLRNYEVVIDRLGEGLDTSENGSKKRWREDEPRPGLAQPAAEGKGHTGYLTFARKAVAL